MTAILWGMIGIIASGLQLGMISLLALQGRLFKTGLEEGIWLLGLYVFGWALPAALTVWVWWFAFGETL